MKKMLLNLIVFAAMVALPQLHAQEPQKDGVLIHISHGSDDPQRLLMALNMANLMAEDHDVLVYFDIKAVDAALKDAVDVRFAQFPSSKTQIKALVDKKVILMTCPGCLKAAGKSKEELATGIQVADKKAFFNFTKGRIMTLDY
jgi:predicted peroxiredoxin